MSSTITKVEFLLRTVCLIEVQNFVNIDTEIDPLKKAFRSTNGTVAVVFNLAQLDDLIKDHKGLQKLYYPFDNFPIPTPEQEKFLDKIKKKIGVCDIPKYYYENEVA